MISSAKKLALLAGALLIISRPAAAELPIPTLVGHVVDQAGVLQAGERAQLESELRDFEHEHGSQVAVLIIRTLANEPIERYSRRVAEHWALGRPEHADGLLLTVVVNDRRMRIEVGTGWQSALPNALCQRILAETLKPHFKKQEYFAGINAALDEVLQRIAQIGPQPTAAAPVQPRRLSVAPAASSGWQLQQQLLLAAGLLLWAISLCFTRRRAWVGVATGGMFGVGYTLEQGLAWGAPIALLAGWAVWMFAQLDWGSGSSSDDGYSSFDSSSSWSSSDSSSSSDASSSSDSSFSGGGASDSW